jgi:nucleotide-binding universal stress UspA family protein
MRPTEDTRRPVTDSVFRRILIPLDGSKRAEAALEAALAIGGLSDAEYVLLRVERPTLPDELYLPRRDSPEIKETSLLGRAIEARRSLGDVSARFGELAASVSTEVRVARSPAAEILREAEVLGPDLIALATRGMVGVERFWLGSVTDKVLRGTNVPVLIVRAPDKVQEDAPADGRE